MTVIEDALEHTTAPKLSPTALQLEGDKLERQITALLPVEEGVRAELNGRLDRVKADLAVADTLNRTPQARLLDRQVLSWRHRRRIKGIPVPALALLSVSHSPQLSFEVSEGGFVAMQPASTTLDAYADVIEGMRSRHLNAWNGRLSATLSFVFNGIIPESTREVIKHEKGSFDQLHLLVESPFTAWEYVERRSVRRKREDLLYDPILLGRIGRNLFVLDVFEPTSVEEYIAAEFTT